MYNTDGKENDDDDDDDDKGMYILLSGTFAVVTSLLLEVLQALLLYMLDVIYIRISILLYGYNPTLHLYRCQNEVLLLFS